MRTNMNFRKLVALVPAGCAALLMLAVMTYPVQNVQAVTIANYQFTGSSAASADPSLNWQTDPITAGTGLSPLNITTQGNPQPGIQNTYGDLDPVGSNTVTLANSIASDNYYSFVVTPDVGASLSFDEFSFDFFSSGSNPATAHLLSSVGGFNTGAVIDSYSATSLPSTFTTATFDVSSLTGVNDPIEFRLYLTRPSVGSTGNTIRTDNILLTGSVSLVPEPSTFLLFGLGALGLVRHSRKRRLRRQVA